MTHLKITGMTCDSCAAHVKEALEKVPGVQSALVSYPKGTAQLATEAGTSPDALTAAVVGLGYKATLADAPPTDNCTGLLDKVSGWMGAADERSDGEHQLQIAVIGSGGSRDGRGAEGRRARRARHADRARHHRRHLRQYRLCAVQDHDPRRSHRPFTPGKPIRRRYHRDCACD